MIKYTGCPLILKSMNIIINLNKNHQVQKEKLIRLPDEILLKYLNQHEVDAFKQSGVGIYSITVYAEKQPSACGYGCNC